MSAEASRSMLSVHACACAHVRTGAVPVPSMTTQYPLFCLQLLCRCCSAQGKGAHCAHSKLARTAHPHFASHAHSRAIHEARTSNTIRPMSACSAHFWSCPTTTHPQAGLQQALLLAGGAAGLRRLQSNTHISRDGGDGDGCEGRECGLVHTLVHTNTHSAPSLPLTCTAPWVAFIAEPACVGRGRAHWVMMAQGKASVHSLLCLSCMLPHSHHRCVLIS